MGYSASAAAFDTLNLISGRCLRTTGVQNNFVSRGKTYFYEVGRENRDGSITGSIYDAYGYRKSGFKISPDGKVVSGPSFFKFPIYEVTLADTRGYTETRVVDHLLEEDELEEYVRTYEAQYRPGGVNYHVRQHLGEDIRVRSIACGKLGAPAESWLVGM